jgi:hypothetical protein
VAHTLVRSFLVIVIHERADDGSEMFLAEWHDAVQALGLVATEDPDESGSSLEPRYFAALLVIETWAACIVPLMS